jgi:alpha-N-acetylglucosaminidase
MEAIDQNPIVYELMSEMSFYRSAPSVEKWTESYAIRRYGLNEKDNEQKETALKAWNGLLTNNYQGESPVCHHPCYRRSIITLHPSWTMIEDNRMSAGPLVNVWTSLLASGISSSNRAYSYDLVDVGRQVMANLFWDYYSLAVNAYNTKDLSSMTLLMKEMLTLINDWDHLLSSHESYLLGKWIAGARSWAADATEADLFDFNARNQVTLWGNNGEIDDYASKNWGGLVKGYYLKRWQLLFSMTVNAMKVNQSLNVDDYNSKELSLGQTFCEDYLTVFPTSPSGDTVMISKEMHTKYGNAYSSSHHYSIHHDKTIDGNNLLETPMWTSNIKQLERLCDASVTCIGFTTEGLLKTSGNVSNLIVKEGVTTYLKGN